MSEKAKRSESGGKGQSSGLSMKQRESFPRWALSNFQKFRKVAGLSAILAAGLAIARVFPSGWLQTFDLDALRDHLGNKEAISSRAFLALVQGLICFLLAVLIPKPSFQVAGSERRVTPETLAALNRIHLVVRATFVLWAIYYAASWVCIRNSAVAPDGTAFLEPLADVVLISLNALTALTLFQLYLELSEVTVEGSTSPMVVENTWTARAHRILSIGVLIVLLVIAWLAWYYSDKTLTFIIDLSVVYLSGLSQCLVTGRLGSKRIDPGPITLSALYLYALIQPLAVLFPVNPVAHLLATTLALVLKILLWLVFVWAFTTGLIGEYVRDIRDFLVGIATDAGD